MFDWVWKMRMQCTESKIVGNMLISLLLLGLSSYRDGTLAAPVSPQYTPEALSMLDPHW